MLQDSGVTIIKLWFEINNETQQKRLQDRLNNPLKHWKISPIDEKASEYWDKYTFYINKLLDKKHYIKWNIIDSNDKKSARLKAIDTVLKKALK